MVCNLSIEFIIDFKLFFYQASADAQQFLQKRLFGIPFPREQRREAKEKYEER